MIHYLALALVLGLAIGLAWALLKRIASWASVAIVNSVSGVLILLFLNIYLDFTVPITLATILVCAFFGIPGVGALLVLEIFQVI